MCDCDPGFEVKMAPFAYFSILLLATWTCQAYKILLVFPLPSKSHGILGEGYVRNLLEAGHEVTHITAFPQNATNPNLKEIDVSTNYFPDIFNINAVMKKDVDLNHPFNISLIINELLNSTFMNKNVQTLINDPGAKFDVVVAEWLFNELNCGFAAVFECPFIWASSLEPHSFILSLVDEPASPAHTPAPMSTVIPPFTFGQRLQELWIQIFVKLYSIYIYSTENNIYEKSFGPAILKKGREIPPYGELKYKASLVLGNSHPALGNAIRLPQSYKAIGGYHMDSKSSPLPENLGNLLKNAKHGFIYFSMGTNLQSKDFPETLRAALLAMFGQLEQTVIWKFEEELNDLPKNVHLFKWTPQRDILSHPNCVAFITHGGLLSTIEAVHSGVPIIGIPIYADQFINIARAEQKGYAKRVDLSHNLADDLKTAVEDVVGDPRYNAKAKELSYVFNNRLIPPGKELVYWVEHVIRTRGAPHLRSPALGVPWHQKLYLDVAVALAALLYGVKATITMVVVVVRNSSKKKND